MSHDFSCLSEKNLDYSQSKEIAQLINAQEYQCWYNACAAITSLPERLVSASYTEGWLVLPQERDIQLIEHSWISCLQERVIDPSIVLLEKSGQQLTYFPALHIQGELVEAIPPGTFLPLAHHLSPTGDTLGYPPYRAAYDAALAYAEQEAQRSGKRVSICPSETVICIKTKKGRITVIL